MLAGLAAACGSAASPVAVAPSPTTVAAIIEATETAAPARVAATPGTVARVGPTATRVPIAPTAEPTPAPTIQPAAAEAAAPTAVPSATPTPTPAPTATPRPQSLTAADTFNPAGLSVGPGSGFISLDEPLMIPAADATWLQEDNIVMGLVAHNGATRAFPISQMAYHHIANLSVAGVPYLVTY